MPNNFAVLSKNPLPGCSIDEVAAAREHLRQALAHLARAQRLVGEDGAVKSAIDSCDVAFDRCTLSLMEQQVATTEIEAVCASARKKEGEGPVWS